MEVKECVCGGGGEYSIHFLKVPPQPTCTCLVPISINYYIFSASLSNVPVNLSNEKSLRVYLSSYPLK